MRTGYQSAAGGLGIRTTVTRMASGAVALTCFAAMGVLVARAADEVDTYTKQLSNTDRRTRQNAAEGLGELGPQAKAAAGMLGQLASRDADARVRTAAARAIGRIGPDAKAGVPGLLTASKDPDAGVRAEAIRSLGKLGPAASPSTASMLINALKDTDPVIRHAAAAALGDFPDSHKASVPALMGVIGDAASPFIGENSMLGIAPKTERKRPDNQGGNNNNNNNNGGGKNPFGGRFGKGGFPGGGGFPGFGDRDRNETGSLEPVRRAAALSLAKLPPVEKAKGEALIVELKKDGADDDRDAAVCRILGEHGTGAKGAAGWLGSVLTKDGTTANLRKAACEALGRIGTAAKLSGVTGLRKALKASEPDVRLAAASALARVTPESLRECLTTLVGAIKSEDESTRVAAASALGEIGPDAKDAVGSLQGALKDTASAVRTAAATALGKIGSEAAGAVGTLAALLDDTDGSVRNAACLALGGIGAAAKPASPAVLAAVKVEGKLDRGIALETLSLLGAPAAEVVPLYLPALEDKNAAVRGRACDALGRLGAAGRPALAGLQERLKDEELSVRVRAAAAIQMIDPSVTAAIDAVLADLTTGDEPTQDAVAAELAKLGPDARPFTRHLGDKLKSTDTGVRMGAAVAVFRLEPKQRTEALKVLVDLTADKDPALRGKAVSALGRLGTEAKAALPAVAKLLRDPDLEVAAAAQKASDQIKGN